MRWKSRLAVARKPLAAAITVALGAGALSMAAVAPAQAAAFVTGTVVDSAGRPVNGAEVYLYDPVLESEFAQPTVVRSGQTDRDGGFKIETPLPAVKVEINGVTKGEGYDLVGEWFNDKPTFAASDAVPAGDLGPISLAPGGSISGVVTSDAGAPLEGIRVSANGAGTSNSSGFATTDAAGAYTIRALPADSYRVGFDDQDYDAGTPGVQSEYLGEYYNDVKYDNDTTPETPVAVGPNAAVGGINAALTPTGFAPQGVDLSGRVVDSTGKAMVGAAVTAVAVGANDRDQRSLERTVTNRQGVYNFTTLDASGEPQVRVVALPQPQLYLTDYAREATWSGNQSSYRAALAIPLVAGAAAAAADIVMPVSGGISGTIAGDASGPSNAGRVLVTDAEGNTVTSTNTRIDGTFESLAIPAGTYYLQFDAEELVPEWWNNAALRSRSKPIVVKSGATTSGLNASLAAGLTVLEKPVVSGVPIVGKELTVTSGVWNQSSASRFVYEWMVDGTVLATGASFTPTAAQVGKKLQVRVTNQPLARVSTPASVTVSTYKVGFKTTLGVKAKNGTARFTLKNQKVKAKKIKGQVIAQLVDSEGKLSKTFGKAKIKKGKGSMALKKVLKKAKGDRKKVVFTFIAKTNKVGAAITTKKANKLRK